MRMIDPFASRLPLMVAAGNHEIEKGSSTGKPFVPYEKRFRMPAIREPVQDYACGRGGGLDGRALGSTSGAATAAAATVTDAADDGGEEEEDLDWCPSVWNGTYDYGNRCDDVVQGVRRATDKLTRCHFPPEIKRASNVGLGNVYSCRGGNSS